MATRYWVGGTGIWTNAITTNWSATSGGSGGASAPTLADDVIFDAGSNIGTGAFTVTVSTSAVCRDISFGGAGGALDGVMTLGGSAAWSIYGSMTLVSTNLTVTYSGTITWRATTTGKTITTAGKSFSVFQFNGVGGGWTLQDALTVTSNSGFNLLAGAVDTNNQTVTSTGGASNFVTSGSSVRSLTLGTTTFNCSGIVSSWNVQTTTNFTLSAASSTINLTTTNGPEFNGAGLTYGTVTAVSTSAGTSSIDISGANTIGTLTITGATTNIVMRVVFSANQTIGTLNVSSTNLTARRFFVSSAFGVTRTLTITTATVSNADFQDITIAGAALTGTSLGDCGGNSNITFDTPKTVYWNLAGAQNWSATAWATSSGGTPALANFPLAQDTAVFDDTGSVTGTITANSDWNIGTLNITKTGAMTLSLGSATTRFYGNITLGVLTTFSGGNGHFITGRSTTQTITTNGRNFPTATTVLFGLNGTVVFADNFTTTGLINYFYGTLDLNNRTITAGTFGTGADTRSIIFGTTGEITLTGSGSVFSFNGTNFTFTGTSKINVSNNSATATSVTLSTGFTSTNALNVNYTTGTYALTEAVGNAYRNLNYSGFSGSVNNVTRTLYENLTLGTGGSYTAGGSVMTFAGGAGVTQLLTFNGRTLNNPITFNGTSTTTYQFADAITLNSSSTTTLATGTLDFNNKTLTTGLFTATSALTKSLLLGSGSLVCTGSGATAFQIGTTNTTLNAGTSTISMTSASTKTFVGAGLTFYNLNQGGAGALTISGANTFNNITNSVQPTTVTFPSSGTQTVSNFGLTGTAGNLVTINSTTPGTNAFLSKSSGIVSCDFLSIRDSNATGGAGWYAGANSTNVSNNTGWIFAAPGNSNFLWFMNAR